MDPEIGSATTPRAAGVEPPASVVPAGGSAESRRSRAALLPAAPSGHWDTPVGRIMAATYVDKARHQLIKGDLTDLAVANAVFMAGRDDLDLMVWQTAAKDRIRWLSVQLAVAHELLESEA